MGGEWEVNGTMLEGRAKEEWRQSEGKTDVSKLKMLTVFVFICKSG